MTLYYIKHHVYEQRGFNIEKKILTIVNDKLENYNIPKNQVIKGILFTTLRQASGNKQLQHINFSIIPLNIQIITY